VSIAWLRRFYLEFKFRSLTPNWTYAFKPDDNGEDLRRQQLVFITTLANSIKADAHLVFNDETSVTLWYRPRKLWMSSRDRLTVKIPRSRRSCFTIYGGISNKDSELVYQFGASTNKDDFISFLRRFKTRNVTGEIIMVLDNHASHRTKDTADLMPLTSLASLHCFFHHIRPS
jgi:hypothetical protein